MLASVPDKLLKGGSCCRQVVEEDENMNPRVLPVLCSVCEVVTGGLAQPHSASQPDPTDQATAVGPEQPYHHQGCLMPLIK